MNFLLPDAFIRSPTIMKLLSCRYSVGWYRLVTAGASRPFLGEPDRSRADASSEISLLKSAMCSGVVPQHPPTRSTCDSSTNFSSASTKGLGCSGYSVRPSTSTGSPALGITLIRRPAPVPPWCLPSQCTCSAISVGPVAQFSPSDRSGYPASALAAASIDVPISIVPVVSIVTDAMIGTSSGVSPRSRIAARHALIAHLTCRMSWQVSMMNTSTPALPSPGSPASSPRACSR